MAAACNVKRGFGNYDGKMKIFPQEGSAGTFVCQSTLNVDAGTYGVRSVSFSPKGDMVAAGCDNGNIFFVDAAAGQIKSSLSVDGQVLVTWPGGGQLHGTDRDVGPSMNTVL